MSAAAVDLIAPTHLWVPDHPSSAGGEVADLAASCGFIPDPEQRLLLDLMFAEAAPGASFTSSAPRWSALESCMIMPRQNAKTATLEMAVLGDLFLLGADLVVWTAHLFQTAAEAFLDFKRLIDSNAHLSRRVKRITEASGNQGVELMTGARLKFITRSKSSGRGLTGDVVVLDEAFALTAAEMGALLPTLSARPNPQVRYASSAGMRDSELLRGIRDRGRAGGDPSLGYAEWCAPKSCASDKCNHALGTPGCACDDPDAWLSANFAMHTRIGEEHIAAERRALPVDEFTRERMGWWAESSADRVIPAPRWAACATESGVISGPVSVGVDVALDRSNTYVAVSGRSDDGHIQVELADVRPGTDWVVDRVAEIIGRNDVVAVGARSAGPVASLLPELRGVVEDAEVPFVKVGSSDFSGQCGWLFDQVMTGSLRHRDDQRLNQALAGARKQQTLDAWQWSRTKAEKDAAPLVAVTLAASLFAQKSEAYDPLANLW